MNEEEVKKMLESIVEESWSDMLGDELSAVESLEIEPVEEGWEVAGEEKIVEVRAPPRPARWCREGNACPWIDCPFRHEKCMHFTQGRCRATRTDPKNCKSPAEGGCQYDHRNMRMLMSCQPIALSSESEMWTKFMPLGLDAHSSSCLALSEMDRPSRKMLIGSLEIAQQQGRISHLDVSDDGKDVTCEWVVIDEPIVYDAEEQAASLKSLTYWEHQVIQSIWRKAERLEELPLIEEMEKIAIAKAYDEEMGEKFAAWRNTVVEEPYGCTCGSDKTKCQFCYDQEESAESEWRSEQVTWRRRDD
jgi:hypothetical protein